MVSKAKAGLAEKVLKGDVAAAARLISLIEDGAPQAYAELEKLRQHNGKAHIIGVTGAPGVGKSTLVDCLIGHFRHQDKKVGVIAIDPTSAFTGGALLGDRVRMQRHSADPGVFIRSLATRGWIGGLARAAIGAVHVIDALDNDVILMETVGSGQLEMDIASAADTTLLVMAPGAGDEIQAMKAGIIEAADIIVINKADKEGAEDLKADLEHSLGLACRGPSDWQPPVLLTQATHNIGISELAEEVRRHYAFLASGEGLARRRRERARLELLSEVVGSVQEGLRRLEKDGCLDNMVDDIQQGRKNLGDASRELMRQIWTST